MIPEHWEEVRRPDDDEVVGYLVPRGGAAAVPTSLVGTALGSAQPASSARALLVRQGLPALDRRWWCRLPAQLPRGITHATEPAADWEWRPVVLVEVSSTTCTVRPEWPAPEEMDARAVLPTPVGNLLREQPPEDRPSRGTVGRCRR